MEIWVNFQRQGQERYGTWIESTLNWTWQRLQLRPEGPIFFFPCHRFGVEVVSKACGLADLAANLDPNKTLFEVPVFLQTYTPVAQNYWKNFGLLLFFFERGVVVLELLFCKQHENGCENLNQSIWRNMEASTTWRIPVSSSSFVVTPVTPIHKPWNSAIWKENKTTLSWGT